MRETSRAGDLKASLLHREEHARLIKEKRLTLTSQTIDLPIVDLLTRGGWYSQAIRIAESALE